MGCWVDAGWGATIGRFTTSWSEATIQGAYKGHGEGSPLRHACRELASLGGPAVTFWSSRFLGFRFSLTIVADLPRRGELFVSLFFSLSNADCSSSQRPATSDARVLRSSDPDADPLLELCSRLGRPTWPSSRMEQVRDTFSAKETQHTRFRGALQRRQRGPIPAGT